MIVDTTLLKLGGTPYYTPPFPRQGLAATFVVDVVELTGSPTVTVDVEHRNRDETSFASLGTFSSITTDGLKTASFSAIKEIVRLKISFAAGDTWSDAIRCVIQSPTWRPF